MGLPDIAARQCGGALRLRTSIEDKGELMSEHRQQDCSPPVGRGFCVSAVNRMSSARPIGPR